MTQEQDEAHDELAPRLRALRVDPPEGEFRATLHRRLVAAGPPPPAPLWQRARDLVGRHPALGWPALGALTGAATFALLAAIALPHGLPGAPHAVDPPTAVGDVAPTYSVPASKVAVIKLGFAADVQVEDVTFEVALPEGLAFWSRGERLAERTFRWPGRLEAGDNVVPIAVRGERPGRYRVRARVEAAGHVLEHDVVLDVKGGA
jgi:hypothetical protein